MSKTFFISVLLFIGSLSLFARESRSGDSSVVDGKRRNAIELTSMSKTFYPDQMGLSPNESLLTMFQTISGLMSINESGMAEKISISVDNESHIFDVSAVLRRIRVMDVDRIEIVNTPDARSGTAGLGVSVKVFLKKVNEGFHGNVALDGNSNGTIDPTMNFGWKKGRWSISGAASFYFDRSRTVTTQKVLSLKEGVSSESLTNEREKTDTYGESASLKVGCQITEKDNVSFSFTQDFLKVKNWCNTTVDSTWKDDYDEEKQHSNSIRLGYGHHFRKQMDLRVSVTARFQDNPHLYNYQSYGMHKQGQENTNSSTKRLFVDVTQTFPLWKNARLTLGEKLDNGLINDLTKVKIGTDDTYYDILSTNSQTKAQINWKLDKWMFELGEVIDFFHYDIAITGMPDKCNNTVAPQTYVSASYNINSQNCVHASYRTGVTRPNYKQIYPVVSTLDAEHRPTLKDSLFRELGNSLMHTFHAGHVFNGRNISVSTNFKTIIVNDKLTKVKDIWMNSERNLIYRLYTSLVWTPGSFTTALSASANLLRYKKRMEDDYENKFGYDIRWMGIYNMKRGWSMGVNLQYNGPVWDAYCKIDNYVYADAHVTKTLKNWSFNACMNDIFDMRIRRTKQTDTMTEVTTEDLDYRGVSVGVSYKF